MSAKKPRLGKGLDALLGASMSTSAGEKEQMREMPVDLLQRGRYQPRTHMDQEALESLASSIKVQGIIQPIVVRELPTGNYEIVAGERRWRAAQLAKLDTVPVVVRNIPDEAAIAVSLIENIQREDLNPVEEANALQRLIDEFGMTHQQVADSVGRSRAAVSNILRLLSLNTAVLDMIDHGKIDMGHGRALLALGSTAQLDAANQVVDRDLSVRETEELVRRLQQPRSKGKKPGQAVDPDVRRLQEELSDRLGAKVTIQHNAAGKGKLVIGFHSSDELEGILDRIR